MIHRTVGFASLAFACALSLGSTLTVQAQDQSTTTKDQTTTTTTETQSSDSSNWQAPRGYDLAYPESGTPNMVARQGYAAGFSQGQTDASLGKKFKPAESDAYNIRPDSRRCNRNFGMRKWKKRADDSAGPF